MKIDLQMHSDHSDGRDTVPELIQLAKLGKLNVIAVTDHDLVSAVEIAIQEGEKENITVIPGLEISTGYRDKPIHVLGYGIDVQHPELILFLQKINDSRKEHFIACIEQLNKNLLEGNKNTVTIDSYLDKEPNYYSIPGLALFLFEQKIVKERTDGFNYLAGIADVAPTVLPKEAFEIIHKTGGKAFLSHPFAPLVSLKNITENKIEQEQIIVEFKNQGLDGLECYQTGHSADDVSFYLELSEKHDLLISAGSDWHGCLEKTGITIKKWLPFYLQKLGDLEIPHDKVEQILKGLGYGDAVVK